MPTDNDDPSTFQPALLIVDFQEDFCPPNGSLAVPGGREIVSTINDLLELPFTLKVATKDWHPADHISFASNHPAPDNQPFISSTIIRHPSDPSQTYKIRLWPVHCVQGTPGAELIPELHSDKVQHVIEKAQDKRVEMYSAFTDPFGVASSPLAAILKQAKITHVYVVGLALDYCVKCTAIDSVKYGFTTYVVREATRAVDPGEQGWGAAERELQSAGVVLVGLGGDELERVKRRG